MCGWTGITDGHTLLIGTVIAAAEMLQPAAAEGHLASSPLDDFFGVDVEGTAEAVDVTPEGTLPE
jgi:hypothetical protein